MNRNKHDLDEEKQIKKRTQWAIQEVLKRPGFSSNKKIAAVSGVSADTINNYRHGRNVPNIFFINNFCREFGFNYDWLVFGFGEPYTNSADKPTQPGAGEAHLEYKQDAGRSPDTASGDSAAKHADYDAFGQAVSMLKTIFDAPDPLYRQAIVANLRSFHRAVGREVENDDLRKQVTIVESRLDSLEKRIEQDKAPPKKALREEV